MYLCAIATGSLTLAGIAAGGFAGRRDGAGFVGAAVSGALAGAADDASFVAGGCAAALPLLVPLVLASAVELGCVLLVADVAA